MAKTDVWTHTTTSAHCKSCAWEQAGGDVFAAGRTHSDLHGHTTSATITLQSTTDYKGKPTS